MFKATAVIIALTSILICAGCTTTTTPQTTKDNQTQTPSSRGPQSGPDSIKEPTSPPPGSDAMKAEVAEIKRTHQSVEFKYTDSDGTHEAEITFNIKDDEVKGILISPRIPEEEKRKKYHALTEQVVFKKISDIQITPDPAIPEISAAFAASYEAALAEYRRKN